MENRYHALRAAARSLCDLEMSDYDDLDELSDDRIHAVVRANQSSLNAARHAISGRCWVPLQDNSDLHGHDFLAVRNLARIFAMEFLSAERRSELAEAVQIGVDILDLANACCRGGVMTDRLVSDTMIGIAINRLHRVRRDLTCTQYQWLTVEMMRVDDEREPFQNVDERDAEWEIANGMTDSAEFPIPENSEEEAALTALQAFAKLPQEAHRMVGRNADYGNTALLRLLAVDSALRACHRISGNYPCDLDALVPEFIESLPLDPFVDRAFRYRPENESFVVYSVGPSGADSGGQFGSWREVQLGNADLCLDVFQFSDG
jgi:hypothetical protein